MDGRMTSPKTDSDFSRLSGNLVPGQLQTLVLQSEYKMEWAPILTRLGKDANVYINSSEKTAHGFKKCLSSNSVKKFPF